MRRDKEYLLPPSYSPDILVWFPTDFKNVNHLTHEYFSQQKLYHAILCNAVEAGFCRKAKAKRTILFFWFSLGERFGPFLDPHTHTIGVLQLPKYLLRTSPMEGGRPQVGRGLLLRGKLQGLNNPDEVLSECGCPSPAVHVSCASLQTSLRQIKMH